MKNYIPKNQEFQVPRTILYCHLSEITQNSLAIHTVDLNEMNSHLEDLSCH